MSYKVLIVEDQFLPRKWFESIIQSSENYSLSASIDTASVAAEYCEKNPVDLVIMDIVIRDGSNGLDAAAGIKKTCPKTKIIIVTSMSDAGLIERARKAGIESFWYKEAHTDELSEVMDRTVNGENVYPENAPVIHLGKALSTEISDRELEVLRLITKGYSDKEISDELFVPYATVRYRVIQLFEKTGFKTRTELAAYAVKCGICVPGI